MCHVMYQSSPQFHCCWIWLCLHFCYARCLHRMFLSRMCSGAAPLHRAAYAWTGLRGQRTNVATCVKEEKVFGACTADVVGSMRCLCYETSVRCMIEKWSWRILCRRILAYIHPFGSLIICIDSEWNHGNPKFCFVSSLNAEKCKTAL